MVKNLELERPRKVRKTRNRGNVTVYDMSLHRIARCMYEIEGLNLTQIEGEIGVTSKTLGEWKQKEQWLVKGAESDKVEYLTREIFVKKLIERGMPVDRAIDLLIEGMTKPSHDVVAGLDENDKPVVHSTPDYKVRQTYQKDFWKMTGMMDTLNKDGFGIHAGKGGTVNVQVNLPSLQINEEDD